MEEMIDCIKSKGNQGIVESCDEISGILVMTKKK